MLLLRSRRPRLQILCMEDMLPLRSRQPRLRALWIFILSCLIPRIKLEDIKAWTVDMVIRSSRMGLVDRSLG